MMHTLKNLLTYEIEAITKENFDEVMEIYKSNQTFFLLTEGKEVQKKDCINDVDAIPKGFDIDQKIFVSIQVDNKKVAVLDLLMDYPDESCVWIGLLLIHDEHKRKGLGSEIISAIFEAVKIKGYKSIQLGVIEKNETALSFWSALGFERIREAKMAKEDGTSVNIIVLGRV